MFHETYGYFADGVDLSTAIVPPGWRERLVLFETEGTHLAAGGAWSAMTSPSQTDRRAFKGLRIVDALLDAGLLDLEALRQRFDALPRDRTIPAFTSKAERWLRSRP